MKTSVEWDGPDAIAARNRAVTLASQVTITLGGVTIKLGKFEALKLIATGRFTVAQEGTLFGPAHLTEIT